MLTRSELLPDLSLGPGQALPLPGQPCSSGSLAEQAEASQAPALQPSPLFLPTSGQEPTGAAARGLRWVLHLSLGGCSMEEPEECGEEGRDRACYSASFSGDGWSQRPASTSLSSFRPADPCWLLAPGPTAPHSVVLVQQPSQTQAPGGLQHSVLASGLSGPWV